MAKKEEKVGLLTDDKGNFSSMRLATIGSMVTILGIFIAQNVQAMIQGLDPVDFGTNSFYIIGVVIGGKAFQKFAEMKKKVID
jgi:hypothetical protein